MSDAPMSYLEMVAAIEEQKAKPPSPSVLHQHLREIQGRARAEAEREAIEEHDNSLERWAERWARRSTDPRFVLPDRPSGDPLVRDRNAL